MKKPDEIDAIVELAEAETGVSLPKSKLRLCVESKKTRGRSWSDDEDAYIRENHGKITESQMAEVLHRTPIAVHLQITREMHLCAPSKDPRILTAEHIGMGFGADGKTIHLLIDRKIMPGRRLPGENVTRVVDRIVFLRWIVKPLNWIYFKTDRVGTMRPRGKRKLSEVYDMEFWEGARELVDKARAKWDDEWLSPGQVAKILHLNPSLKSHPVNRAIHTGNLKAVRWGNWRILRSDLPPVGMTFNIHGKIMPMEEIGRNHCGLCGEVGHSKLTCAIRRTKKWNHKTGRRYK